MGGGEYYFLGLVSKGIASSFSPFKMMVVGLSHIAILFCSMRPLSYSRNLNSQSNLENKEHRAD